MKIFKKIAGLGMICGAIFISSCDKDGVVDRGQPATGARVVFVHASPDAPHFNFFVNNTKITGGSPTAAGVEQGMAYSITGLPITFGYAVVDPGTLAVKAVVAPSSTTAAPGSELFNTSLSTEDNKYYSVFALDQLANISPLVLTDNLIAEPGKAGIRFVNAISGSAPVNVTATFTEVGATTSSTATIASNVAFKSATEFISSAPGRYVFQMKDAATGANVGAALTVTFLRATENYTVYGRGITAGVPGPAIAGFYNR